MNLSALAPLLLALGAAPAEPPVLTLDAALVELDQQSPTLTQARSRAGEASAGVRQAAAALLPTLSASVGYLRNSDSAELVLPAAMGGRTVVMQAGESTTVSGTVRVPLLVPTAWFDLAATREGARAADLSAAATRLALRTGFAQAAYLAVAAEERVGASERAVANADELARSSARRVAAGTAAPLDVTRARAELVRRQSDLVGAHADLDRARLALGVMLGRGTPVQIAVPEVAGAPAPELEDAAEAQASEALARRPEVAAQRAQLAAAEEDVRSAWARLAPQLSASASLFAADVPYVTGDKDGWRATVDLTWPLYDGGFRYGKRRQAEAQAAGARAGLEGQRLAVLQDVEDGRRDLGVARERLRLAEAQAALAADAAASAKRSFDAGVASSLDVIDANDRLYQADTGLADARARAAQARLGLLRALGRDGRGTS